MSAAAHAAYPEVNFSANSIEFTGFQATRVRGSLDTEGRFKLAAGELTIENVLNRMPDVLVEGAIEEFLIQGEETVIRAEIQAGVFNASLDYTQQPEMVTAGLMMQGQDLLAFRDLPGAPPQADWFRQGAVDAGLRYTEKKGSPARIALQLKLNDLGFDSPDGRFAGEALSLALEAAAPFDRWNQPGIKGSVTGGEVLLYDFYRDFSDGGLDFAFKPRLENSRLKLESIRLTDNFSLTVEGRGELASGDNAEPWKAEVSRLNLEFPGAYERYMESLAARLTLNGLGVTGSLSWSGQWSGGTFRSGDLTVTGLSIVDTQRNRFAFTGLDARMRPGDYSFDSRLSWRGLLLGRINLGAGEISLDSEPGTFRIVRPLSLDVLGGQVNLREMAVLLPGGSTQAENEPDIRLRADIEDVDMKQLTEAFGWPAFSGKISGVIPGVSLDDGVLDVEGKIQVSVFDGLVSLDDLRVERPFGVLPSLAANVEIEDLDLEMLTSTFSFGQISGRVDGYIRDLRMLDWKPVAFDAWLGTPDRQTGKRDISRKAVNRLTTLGGGQATTALTSPLLKIFNRFSYKRLGLGCRMQNNVCELRGVSQDDASVLIMEGAGVPKVTIRAFNRRVDWPQLLAQLVAASEGDSVRVGD